MTERKSVGVIRHVSVYISTATVFMGVFLWFFFQVEEAFQLGQTPVDGASVSLRTRCGVTP